MPHPHHLICLCAYVWGLLDCNIKGNEERRTACMLCADVHMASIEGRGQPTLMQRAQSVSTHR